MPYQMSNGKWRATKMINGQRKTRSFSTKTEAKKWEASQTEKDWQQETNTVCLLDACTAYLDYASDRFHPDTCEEKRRAMRRMFEYVKPESCPEAVTPRIALSIIMGRDKASGPKSANKDRKNMGAFWEWGRKFYAFPANPFQSVPVLPVNCQPHYVPPPEDFWKVHAIADEVDRVMLLTLLYTGGRRSSVFNLVWETDIDLQERRIRLSTCKTADGSRKYEWLSMPRRLHAALSQHKLRTGGHGYVFTNKFTGEKYRERQCFLTRLCDKAGVKRFNYHGIRGLCATLLAAGGVSMKDIQTVLMHTNMTTTDRYIRRLGKTQDVLAAAFDKFDDTEKAAKVVAFTASK